MPKNFHETLAEPEWTLPPDRSTGLVFVVVALVVAFFWRADTTVLTVALGIAALLAVISFAAPRLLRPLNIVWMRFALLLSKVMNPIIMFVLFVVLIVPAGLVMRIWYDPLRKRRKSEEATYWVERGETSSSSMTEQF